MAARILVVHAHPYPKRSRAGRALLDAVRDLPDLTVRSLYDLYPDFGIDVATEQQALRDASAVVWQSPFYWYGVPSLLTLWFEKVLDHGFAYGPDARGVAGKPLLWVTTTGTPLSAYRVDDIHHQPFEAFVPPVQETARFCGMHWQPPIIVHGAHEISDEELATHANTYRTRVQALGRGEHHEAELRP